MLKSLRKVLSLRSNYCIKQRSEHGEKSVALPVQLPNCNDCDHIVVEERENGTTAEGDRVDSKHDANADSSFVHAVINMVGMLIGKFCLLFLYLLFLVLQETENMLKAMYTLYNFRFGAIVNSLCC